MATISVRDIKTLFALSGNTCSYTGCEQKLTDPSWSQVKADMAHICGERPGSARYDQTMTEKERNSFANLILVCPNCHRLIDRLDPETHTVEVLLAMNQRHESRSEPHWAPDEALTTFAEYVIAILVESESRTPIDVRPVRDDWMGDGSASLIFSAEAQGNVSDAPKPALTVDQRDSNAIYVVNDSDSDVFGITVTALVGSEVVELASIVPPRVSAHQAWNAGYLRRSDGSNVPVVIRLHWKDSGGHLFERDSTLD